ncbi:hypothetical protein T484DRAFT_1786110, partial [Baffinella frigidus]
AKAEEERTAVSRQRYADAFEAQTRRTEKPAYQAELAAARESVSGPLEKSDALASRLASSLTALEAVLQQAAPLAAKTAAAAAKLEVVRRENATLRAGPGSALGVRAEALLEQFPPLAQPSPTGRMPGEEKVYPMSAGLRKLRATVQGYHTGQTLRVFRRGLWEADEAASMELRVARIFTRMEARNGSFYPEELGPVRWEVRTIPDTDPREALRGAKGLFVKENVRRGEVLAPYAGRILTEKEYQEKHSFILQLFAHDMYSYRFSKETSHPWKNLGPQGNGNLGHTITSDVDKLVSYIEQPGGDWSNDTAEFSDDHLIIDAFSEGNSMMFANDFRRDPFGDPSSPKVDSWDGAKVDSWDAPGGEGPRPNADFIEVLVKGWPHLAIVVTSDIPAGG